MSISFAHIAPTKYLTRLCGRQTTHLVLAHMIQESEEYANWYRNLKATNSDNTVILDNSAFELYQQGKPMFDPNQLLQIGMAVKADYIVLPDYPDQPASKTINAGIEYAKLFKDHGFGTFFVPQSNIGDIEDYITAFSWAASSPLIDYIGISILGVPNAFSVADNPLQRYTSRACMMRILDERELLNLAAVNNKKIHFLGMLDGPNEIDLVSNYRIDTWDSSAAVWAGLNGISFDSTPTGLTNGKVKAHVDFNYAEDNIANINKAQDNISYINDKCNSSSFSNIEALSQLLNSGRVQTIPFYPPKE